MKVFKRGTTVRLIQPEVAGVVVGGTLSASGDEINYRVMVTLPNGEPFARDFSCDDLEVVAEGACPKLLGKHMEHVEVLRAAAEHDETMAQFHREANGDPVPEVVA